MPSLRALTILLVALVLVPAAILGWLGWRGAGAWEDAVRARLDAELQDGRARIVAAAAEVGRGVETEVTARMEDLAALARRALPDRGVADGMLAVVEGAPSVGDPPLRALRLEDAEGRVLWPSPYDPDRPASDEPADRLRFDLAREAARRRARAGVAAARAFWDDVVRRAPNGCFGAWARGEAARLFEPGDAVDPFTRLRDLEASLPSVEGDCAGRARALLLIQAAVLKDGGAAAELRRRWREGFVARVPLTSAERARALTAAARGAPDPAWCPALLARFVPSPSHAELGVGADLPGGARLAASVDASDVRAAVARGIEARVFADVRVQVLPGPAAAPDPAPTSGVRYVAAPSAFGVSSGVLYDHRRGAEFEASRKTRRLLTVGGVLALLLLMGVGLAVVRRALRREREASRLRDDFVANVSHELRTPLASVLLHADLLAEPGVDAARRERLSRVVQAEGARLGALVEDLLDFEALSRGGRALECEPLDVVAAVRRAVLPYEAPAAREGVALDVDVPRGEVAAFADPHAVGRILANLLSNAWRHGRPSRDGAPGRIAVRVGREGPLDVVVEVADDGPGIPPSERAGVFERFRRGAAAGVRGTGLGLALARDLARAMEGDLQLRASEEGPGGRTTFRLRLPSDPEPPEAEA